MHQNVDAGTARRRRREINMLYVVLAQLIDPVVVVPSLIAGRLSRSWFVSCSLAVAFAFAFAWLHRGSSLDIEDVGLRLLTLSPWMIAGGLWGRAARARKHGGATVPQTSHLNPLQQLRLGRHITRMTNWAEAIEATRSTRPIGAGGGLDSLPAHQQVQAYVEMKASRSILAKYPPYVVTAVLLRNQKLAMDMGRVLRADAIQRLWDSLISDGIATEIDGPMDGDPSSINQVYI